ncbi:MAG: NINE protein [Flavobacteriaceae bacterium]|jgi:TM2 domain-containing membrane protein YozV|nr:MAG: NINE protein [Flavobacteriaceae bacterium]
MSEEEKNQENQKEKAFDKAKKKAKELKEEAKEKAEEIKREIKQDTEKVKEKARQLKEDAKEKAHEAREKAEKFKEEVKEDMGEFSEEAKKTADEFSEGLKTAGGDNKKILAGILAIFLGWAGIHKFILGYQKEGIILLVVSIIGFMFSCVGIGVFLVWATGVIGLVEGIIYLTKSDEEFYNTYEAGHRPWF